MLLVDSRFWIWNDKESIACDGAAIFLLRDNVQHFLEAGIPSERFAQLHALADGFWSERIVALDAALLRSELFAAWDGTWRLPISQSAVSIATGAALRGVSAPPGISGTTTSRSARRLSWRAVDEDKTVGQLVGNVVGELMALSWTCKPGERVRMVTPRIAGESSPLRHARAIESGLERREWSIQ